MWLVLRVSELSQRPRSRAEAASGTRSPRCPPTPVGSHLLVLLAHSKVGPLPVCQVMGTPPPRGSRQGRRGSGLTLSGAEQRFGPWPSDPCHHHEARVRSRPESGPGGSARPSVTRSCDFRFVLLIFRVTATTKNSSRWLLPTPRGVGGRTGLAASFVHSFIKQRSRPQGPVGDTQAVVGGALGAAEGWLLRLGPPAPGTRAL